MSLVGVGLLFPMLIVGGLLLTLFVLLLAGQGGSDTVRTLGRVVVYVMIAVLGLLCFALVAGHFFAPRAHTGPVRAYGVAWGPIMLLLVLLGVLLTGLLVNKATRKATAYVLLGLVLVAGTVVFVGFSKVTYREQAQAQAQRVEARAAPARPPSLPAAVTAPIWSEAIAEEFDADIYPSRVAAARALGGRMEGPIRRVAPEPNAPRRIVVFWRDDDRELAVVLAEALAQALPNVLAFAEAGPRNLESSEVGIELRQVVTAMPLAPWARTAEGDVAGQGRIEATAFTRRTRTTINESFVEKPWVESFAAFANQRPGWHYAVARSNGACTSESEARQQALQNAAVLVLQAASDRMPGSVKVSPADLQDMGLVVDTFVQSFDSSVGRIWRQAVLLDLSNQKLATLAQAEIGQVRAEQVKWAFLLAQALGVFVVIFLAYLFLNMATRGYYDWALRIAAAVLAVALVVILYLA